MDERTYRRVFCETPFQTRMRHNGLSGVISYRRCRGCEGTGRVLDEHRLTTDVPHKTCSGSGLVPYKRTR